MRRLLLLVIALIVYGSLFPWHFDFTRGYGGNPLEILLYSPFPEWDKFTLRDAAINILLYVPLGLAASLALLRGHARAVAVTLAVLIGLALSASIEMLQIYVPTRTCSMIDIVTNAIGAAIGALLGLVFRPQLEGISKQKLGRNGAAPAILWICWLGYQLFPFFPILSRTRILVGLALLRHLSSVSAIEVWASAAAWFAAGVALEALLGGMRIWWLAGAMLCLPARLVIADRVLSLHEVLGGALALLMWIAIPDRSRARWGAGFLASAIALRELAPFYFLAVPIPFSWVPFQATFQADREAATVVLCLKAFEYGAMVWLLRMAGNRYAIAGLVTAAGLAGLEATQRYLPGRTPEITDCVLAIVMTFVLWRFDRLRRNSSR